MNKIYLLVAFAFSAFGVRAQCNIDSAARTTPGIYPAPDSIPCAVVGVPYEQTIQVQCPPSFDTSINLIITNYGITVTVDSMELDSVIGLPYGISWVKNPNTLLGGQNGCLTFSGTANDATGVYNLLWYGTVWASPPSPLPTKIYTGVLNQIPGFNYYLGVINQGDACPPANVAGIKSLSLNAAVSVSPNPTTGVFEFKLNAESKVTGDIVIDDITGRTVYLQHINGQEIYHASIDLSKYARGLYTLELRTIDGFASKKLVIE